MSYAYFAKLVSLARIAAEKAKVKFPQPNYTSLKIAEEAGEVIRGCVHYAEDRMPWEEVEGEIVQLIAMLMRLVEEGDHRNGIMPPSAMFASYGVDNFPDCDYYYFKEGGKWKYQGEGFFPAGLNVDRTTIMNSNEGNMPGISGNAIEYFVLVVPREYCQQPYAYPRMLKPIL